MPIWLPLSALLLLGGSRRATAFGRRRLPESSVLSRLFRGRLDRPARWRRISSSCCWAGFCAGEIGARPCWMPNSLAILGQSFSGAAKGRRDRHLGVRLVRSLEAVGPVLGRLAHRPRQAWRGIFLLNVPLGG